MMAVSPKFRALFSLGTLVVGALAQTAPTVDLGYAQYQGGIDATNNMTSFIGVRYAAAPTGTSRFQAPQAPEATSGVQPATALPAQCHQGPTGTDLANPYSVLSGEGEGWTKKAKRQSGTSEDCLFLSVFVPGSNGDLPANSTYPVLVYIHGGGYVMGSVSQYNGADLEWDGDGAAIVVTIQYRLGLFGFLPGTEVKENGALNAGLLDQNFALQWVQQYISLFGGDPTRVTIWGESAGAGSVFQHIVANNGQTDPPLFRAVLTSSTFVPSQYWYNDTVPELLYAQVVEGANCTSSNSSFGCLQEVDADSLGTLNSNLANAGFYGTYIFAPVIDGEFIVGSPTAILKAGNANGEVLLSFTNTFEGAIFVSTNSSSASVSNATLYAQELFPFLSDAQAQQVAAMYANDSSDPTALDQSVGIMGESIFICPTYLLLQTFQALNRSQWKGEFAIPPGYHAEDLGYYFDEPYPYSPPPFANADFQIAFSQTFLNTAVSMNPNDKINASSITPSWPVWSCDNQTAGVEMVFNTTDGTNANAKPVIQTVTTDSTLLERCAVWQSLASVTGQ